MQWKVHGLQRNALPKFKWKINIFRLANEYFDGVETLSGFQNIKHYLGKHKKILIVLNKMSSVIFVIITAMSSQTYVFGLNS